MNFLQGDNQLFQSMKVQIGNHIVPPTNANIDKFAESQRVVLSRDEAVREGEELAKKLTGDQVLALFRWYKKDGKNGTTRSKAYGEKLGDRIEVLVDLRKQYNKTTDIEVLRPACARYREWIREQINTYPRLRASKALSLVYTPEEILFGIELDRRVAAMKQKIKANYRPINLTTFMVDADPRNPRELSPIIGYLKSFLSVSASYEHEYITLAQVQWNSLFKPLLGDVDGTIKVDDRIVNQMNNSELVKQVRASYQIQNRN